MFLVATTAALHTDTPTPETVEKGKNVYNYYFLGFIKREIKMNAVPLFRYGSLLA